MLRNVNQRLVSSLERKRVEFRCEQSLELRMDLECGSGRLATRV